ncbi:MAG TPA: hypothetical protein VNM69_13355 [Bacillus sp. (in: firmicutes)]|uniref:hypothetical protein n=1 Tax=Bacillus litorisediminis TaxID=2922713 RepID=UPI001FABC036|nr:hypothetical protein [Bacillus litorisediminis]HWO76857.1 hypothetical protein [Bacillus sp. (in: firmicutes)]
MKKSSNEIKRGQTISFRIPSDTPDHLLKHLQKLKETERRNFSSRIAEFVLEGVGKSYGKEREAITVPLPQRLSKSQRDWLKHEHSEALLGSIVYHLLSDPVRATSLLASLNSNSLDINEALYLQEDQSAGDPYDENRHRDDILYRIKESAASENQDEWDDDLQSFDWERAKQNQQQDEKEDSNEESNLEELLGDFLSKMNK